MSLTKKTFGRNATYLYTLGTDDVKSYIDLDIILNNKDLNFTAKSPTGLANDATTYNTSISINSVVYPLTVIGASGQTFSQLASTIDGLLSTNGDCVLLESDRKLRIKAANSGDVEISVSTVGSLPSSIVGDSTLPLHTEYLPPVRRGGAQFRLTPAANSSNPIDAINIINVNDSTGVPVSTYKIVYDNTKGTTTVSANGADLSSGTTISITSTLY